MASRWRLAVVSGALLFVLDADVSAQTIDDPSPALPRAFVGAALAPATSDPASRMRLFEDRISLVWFAEGGAAVSRRIGVGAEFAQPPTVTASTRGQSFNTSGRQQERTLVGVVRGRVWAVDRIAADIVGGAGLLWQHHELRFAPCFSGCADTRRETLMRRAPAFVLGAEMPVRLGNHFAVAVIGRYYALHRGDHVSEPPVLVPWQFESKSSMRFSLGVGGRAVW